MTRGTITTPLILTGTLITGWRLSSDSGSDTKMDYQLLLKKLKHEHEFFIGIDSDGCVFDTMEIKQKEFFIPNALKYFELQSISEILKETWEFVNLYSVFRGGNRFTSLIRVFELLGERQEIKDSGLVLPDRSALKEWVKTETKLGNNTLREYFEKNYDPLLEKVVNWTEAVNREISRKLCNIPPFPYARQAIISMSEVADLMIVSQTPLEALTREWEEHNMMKYVKAVAGQEHGTKSEHISLAAKGHYHDNKILMIGDARGDLDAAQQNGILFYPIIPGKEDESWKIFINEGLVKIFNGTFQGTYGESLLNEFEKSLPKTPPWN
jgi:phosphoglycolate phosphatase-like HAD superfamily hydrolase